MKSAETWPPKDKKEAEIFFNSYMPHATTQDSMLLNVDEVKHDFGKDIGARILATLDLYKG